MSCQRKKGMDLFLAFDSKKAANKVLSLDQSIYTQNMSDLR